MPLGFALLEPDIRELEARVAELETKHNKLRAQVIHDLKKVWKESLQMNSVLVEKFSALGSRLLASRDNTDVQHLNTILQGEFDELFGMLVDVPLPPEDGYLVDHPEKYRDAKTRVG
ncbi:MAG: hypothetical protein LBT38_12295 [Deltaproteobacteria bacterium]|jgi:uncharacterized coiled-coil protein SlyX|nr:hypothetical protein [Deltaproteobacteria bacterium]